MKKNSSMKVRVPGSKQAIEQMKYEIANEFGVNLGADASSRSNGRVGGEITKRLIEKGMGRRQNNNNSSNRQSQSRSKSNSRSKNNR